MDDFLENILKLLVLIGAFFGVHKYATKLDKEQAEETKKRVKALEDGKATQKDMDSIEDRVDLLESEKQDKEECARLQAACPMVVSLKLHQEFWADVKKCQEEMVKEVRAEFKSHHELHLAIAREMGERTQKEKK